MKKAISFVLGAWVLLSAALYFYYDNDQTLVGLASAVLLLGLFLIIYFGLSYFINQVLRKKEEVIHSVSGLALLGIFWLLVTITSVILLVFVYEPSKPLAYSLFIAASNILAIFVVYSSITLVLYASGKRLLTVLKIFDVSPIADFVLSMAGGVVVVILFFYGASVFHVLGIMSILLFLIFSATLCFDQYRSGLSSFLSWRIPLSFSLRLQSRESKVFVAICIALVFFTFSFISASAFAPIDGDSARTYFNVPNTFIENSGVTAFAYQEYNNGPHAYAYVYAPIILIFERAINYINIYFLSLLMLALYAFANVLYSKKVATISVLLFFIMPLHFWFMSTTKIDYLMSFVLLVAALAVALSARSHSRSYVIFAGACMGIAVAIKYTALFVLPGLFLFYGIMLYKKQRRQDLVVSFGILAIVLSIFFSPFALQNVRTYGNPLYPYSVLGGTTEVFFELSSDVRQKWDEFYSVAYEEGQGIGPQNHWYSNLFALLVNDTRYAPNQIGPLFLGLLPFVLLFFLRSREHTTIALSAAVVSGLVVWLNFTPAQAWYVFPVFPIACILLALAIADQKYVFFKAALISVCALMLITNVGTKRLFFVTFLSGTSMTESALERLTGGLTVYEYLNTEIRSQYPDYVVFPFGQLRSTLIDDNYRHLYGDNVYLSAWVQLVSAGLSSEEIQSELARRGITHVYYIKPDIDAWRQSWCVNGEMSQSCQLYQDVIDRRFDDLKNDLVAVKETDRWSLYQIPDLR